jgi:hypothetical protein
MLSLHAGGLDPELGLPVLGGERVPVAVAALRRRLQGVRTVGLAGVVADLDDHLARLRDGDPHTELAVLSALQRAEVASLRAATAAVARLLAVLHPNHRLALVRTGGERRAVFLQALTTIPTEEVA